MNSLFLPIFAATTPPADERGYAVTLIWSLVALGLAVLLWPGGRGRRTARQIFAVATLAFREGLRLKVLWMVFLLAMIAGVLTYFSDADGTHSGRAALIIDTCMSVGEVLGACLIVLLSALSVAREIESRIMHTFGVKPVPRWSILLGKALGFWSINLLFLAGVTLMTGALVRAVPLRPQARKASALVESGTWEDLRRNTLTTREYEEAENISGSKYKMVRPGSKFTWVFPVDSSTHRGEPLALRFLLSSTYTFNPDIKNVGIKVGYADEKPIIERVETVPQDRPFDLFIPPEALNKNAQLGVTITAGKADGPSVIGSVKLGIAADGIVSNLIKAFFITALQGWILALITTSWSGVLSFPVTVALGGILVLGGEMSRQALDILQSGATRAQTMGLESGDSNFTQTMTDNLRILLQLLPDFRAAGSPASFIEGNFLSGWVLAKAALLMGLVRTLAWSLPGVLFFQRREVGR